MENLIDSAPEIIKAAAQSNLGMLALLAIALAALSHLFFSGASESVRVGIFLLLFLAVVSFGVAIFRVDSEGAQKRPPTAVTHPRVPDKSGGTWGGTRDQMTVFVDADGVVADTAGKIFLEQLRANGFRVADSRDEAALVVQIAGQVSRFGSAPRGEGLYSGVVEVSLNARWADDGSTLMQAHSEGNGVSSSEQNAQRHAFAKAAQLLFARFLEQVDKSVPPASAAPPKVLSHSTR